QTETEATGAPQKHHYTLNQQVGSITLYLPHITGFYCYFKRQKNALASIWLSFMAMSVHTKWKVIENSQLPGSYFLTILIQKAQKTQQIT
ncbi:hypothetical protein R1L73_19910, partial [Klebsiella sp. 92020]|uniref:hypothetical protein n=1 Tax=Klebsiella TaxID=570 RepID=UPI00223EDA9D